MNTSSKAATLATGLVVLATILSPVTQDAAATSFSEPHTIFYGKVLGTGSAQDFLITSGSLRWTILRSDGIEVSLETTLFDLGDGMYSYRLHVPHSAFALGLETGTGGIPLPLLPAANVHKRVTVDGEVASLLGPASVVFTTEQLRRTATYRMDLALGRVAPDTDGDGIADWWEDRYGLDKQDASDARRDFSGDGLTALDAYLRGLDPRLDARVPALLTGELLVYRDGSTAVLLDTADLDSAAAQVAYTLTALPAAGALWRRNAQAVPSTPDAVLAVGDGFTQADLLAGRVLYVHDGTDADPGIFTLSVRDENPAHPAVAGDVRLLTYQPPDMLPATLALPEARWLSNHYYARIGHVILDAADLPAVPVAGAPSAGLAGAALAAYRAAYGDDRPHVLVGGGAGRTLAGGHRDDVLAAAVNGGTLTGGPGADRFMFEDLSHGRTVVSDFSLAENDTIDLSNIPAPAGSFAHRYLRFMQVAGVTELQVALDAVAYTNLAVALPTLLAADADLYKLVETRRLQVGLLALEPRISVTATVPRAAQSGPTPGRFTLRREGSLANNLPVSILLSGTAVNGTDYEPVSPVIVMQAGVATLDIDIMPYMTGYQGPEKVAHLTLAAGTGYRLGAATSAKVTIENLAMVVELDVIENPAVVETGTRALIRLRRRYVTSGDALVRLSIGGTARSGTDYEPLPTLVTMAAGQTSLLLEVKPKAGASWTGGARTVTVTLLPDADYLVNPVAGIAQAALIMRVDSLATWRLREFGVSTGDLAAFAAADSGGRGATHLQRYAFGLGAQDPVQDGLPRPLLHNGRRLVTFRKPLDVQGSVIYRVRGMTDLMRPAQTVAPVTPVAAPEGTPDPEQVYYEVSAPAGAHVFITVEVEWKP